MKKIILLLAFSVFSMQVSFSQESKANEVKSEKGGNPLKWTYGITYGTGNFYNNSGLSTFDYHLDTYKSTYGCFDFGFEGKRGAGLFIGLATYGTNFQYESGMKEINMLVYPNISTKLTIPIIDKLSVSIGAGVGMLYSSSQIYYSSQEYKVSRKGFGSNINFGLVYKATDWLSFGAKVGALTGALKFPEVPTALESYKSNRLNEIVNTNSSISMILSF